METLDLLINKFKEFKQELEKNSPPLHDTVEGFMGGLKALPKGSPERGKFITTHMNHGPFLTALQAHPQGQQMHSMLTGHLNSTANAGLKPGKTQTVVKSDDLVDDLEKAYISPYYKYGPSKPAPKQEAKPAPAKPARLTGSDKIAAVSQEKIHGISEKQGKPAPATAAAPVSPPKLTGLDRIKAAAQQPMESMSAKVKKDEADKEDEKKDLKKGLFGMSPPMEPKRPFTPSFKGHKAALGVGTTTAANGVTTEQDFDPLKQQTSKKKFISIPFGKTINSSYSAPTNGSNMQMSQDEKLTLNKGGQWNLEKKHIGFKALEGKLENEGHSEESAGAIAASIGRKKYGAKKMADMAHKAGDCYKDEDPKTGEPKGTVAKDEGSDHCSKCKSKPCKCNSTQGVLLDKTDAGNMNKPLGTSFLPGSSVMGHTVKSENPVQNSVHCGGKTCKTTASKPDQSGRTCGCSCKGCNPAVNKVDGGDMSVGSGC